MSEARDARIIAENYRQAERLAKLGWYHSIELPDGSVIEGHQSLEQQRRRVAQFPIPEDLTGKRVLDIGAWDGWFSFEMERRGADVLALDATRNTKLLEAKRLLGSRIDYRIGDICRLTWRDLGKFDIVLFFGVLYHLKHPLLALENVCGMCTDMAFIESFVSDSNPDGIPVMEFYEAAELRGQLDNWVGPNAACLLAFCRTAGFARVRYEGALAERGHVTGYRNWEVSDGADEAPFVRCLENSASHDHQFSSEADDYLTLYFTHPAADLNCDNVQAEVGGYGARPFHVARVGDGWQAAVKLPPGLDSGWHEVRLRTAGSAWSVPLQLAVGAGRGQEKEADTSLAIVRITDGKTFEDNRAYIHQGGALSAWAAGLPDDVDVRHLRLRLDGTDLPAIWIAPADGASPRQVNALLPSALQARQSSVSIVYGERESAPVMVELCRSF